jgi:hypothetical protein
VSLTINDDDNNELETNDDCKIPIPDMINVGLDKKAIKGMHKLITTKNNMDHLMSDDDFEIPIRKNTSVYLKRLLNKRSYSRRLAKGGVTMVHLSSNDMILNNFEDSIVLIKSMESLITVWFYPLNHPL